MVQHNPTQPNLHAHSIKTECEIGFVGYSLITRAARIMNTDMIHELGLEWVFLGTIIVLFGGCIGLKWVSKRYDTIEVKTMGNRIKLLNDYAADLKRDLQRTRGKLSGFNTKPMIDANLEEGDLEQLIPKLMTEYSGMAPKWAKPFLSDPSISGYLIKLAKENPEQAKSFIKQFVGSKITDESGPSDTESEQLESQRQLGA